MIVPKGPSPSGFRGGRIGDQLLGLSNCPHCGTAHPTLKSAWHSQQPTYRADSLSPSIWAAYGCTSCGSIVTAKGKPGATESNPFIVAIFPAPWEADATIPARVAKYLKQAKGTLSSADASVLMSAAAIDAMLKDKNVNSGSLNQRIDEAVRVGLITNGMAEWAHRVRLDGNDSRHADAASPDLSWDDAQRAM